MSANFPGKGRRRPQLDLPLELIELDFSNPRLSRDKEFDSEFDILKILYEEFDLEEIAMSMSENGYFDEEPIIVVPKDEHSELFKGDTDDIELRVQKLIEAGSLSFTVVEGNRRIGTAKLLADKKLREKLKIRDDSFPQPKSGEILEDLKLIPAILYNKREDVAPYLGIRHIAGSLKWDAFAKAAYIAKSVELRMSKGESISESIKSVQMQVADRTDVIRKQYLCFKILKEAEEDLQFDVSRLRNKFSLLTVAFNSPSIRNYVGSPSYKEVDFASRIIPLAKIEQFRNLLTWIYGSDKQTPILSDSRKITSELAPVLASKEATEFLVKNGDLSEAFERSDGERNFIVRKINSASSSIKYSLGFAWKYREDQEIRDAINECSNSIAELAKMMNS